MTAGLVKAAVLFASGMAFALEVASGAPVVGKQQKMPVFSASSAVGAYLAWLKLPQLQAVMPCRCAIVLASVSSKHPVPTAGVLPVMPFRNLPPPAAAPVPLPTNTRICNPPSDL